MLGTATRQTTRASVCALSFLALGMAAGEADAKPKSKSKAKPPADEVEILEESSTPVAKDKGQGKGKKKPEPQSDDIVMTTVAPDGTKIETVELEEEEPPPPPEEEPAPSAAKQNWVSLSIQQDSLIYGSTPGVCPAVDAAGKRTPGNDQYSCRDSDGVYPDPVFAAGGNQVNGGFGLATTRLLAGYDRLFIHRLLVGARVGYAFRMAPSAEGAPSSLPLHLEARGAYYFLGQRPFETPGFRPFASLGLGVAEVDGVVAVDIYDDQAAYAAKDVSRLHAWRRAGPGFAAPGGGASYAIGDLMINAELRFMINFPAVATGVSLNAGVSYGL